MYLLVLQVPIPHRPNSVSIDCGVPLHRHNALTCAFIPRWEGTSHQMPSVSNARIFICAQLTGGVEKHGKNPVPKSAIAEEVKVGTSRSDSGPLLGGLRWKQRPDLGPLWWVSGLKERNEPKCDCGAGKQVGRGKATLGPKGVAAVRNTSAC